MALKLIADGIGILSGPVYGHMHDAYHVKPNQLGEGASGSGLIFRTTAVNNETDIFSSHVIIADDAKEIIRWNYSKTGSGFVLEKDNDVYSLNFLQQDPLKLELKKGNKLTVITQLEDDYFLQTK